MSELETPRVVRFPWGYALATLLPFVFFGAMHACLAVLTPQEAMSPAMFCSLLNYYYDLNEADRFEQLFGHTWIGQHPTGNQNRYMILYLNFSSIEVGSTLPQIESSFRSKCNTLLGYLMDKYAPRFEGMAALDARAPVADNLNKSLLQLAQACKASKGKK